MGFRVQRNIVDYQAGGSRSTVTPSSWVCHELRQVASAFDVSS